MKLRAFTAASVLLTGVLATPADAAAPATVIPRRPRIEPGYKEHPDLAALRRQMVAHPQLPPVDFWFAVAQCETAQEWDRGFDWGPNAKSWVSGGLGIANKTWIGYGGRRFASKAAKASLYAQIFIANRIGFLGYQTAEYRTWEDRVKDRPHFRPAAGFDQGWGGSCRRHYIYTHGGDQ